MHELVRRIKDPALCYVFAENARRRGHPDLALQACRRAVDLRAEAHEADSEVERDAFKAIYAYEEALSHSKGKRTRATGTWQLVSKHGVLAALVKRWRAGSEEALLPVLSELGLDDYSFEAVYKRHAGVLEALAA